jgi:glutathione S-transferase
VRLQETLNYLTSEIHKAYSPLFNPQLLAAVREERLAYLKRRYALIEKQLEGKQFLFGDRFTVADAYLFVLTNWARGVKLDLSEFPNLLAFQKRVAARPAVRRAMVREGLIKDAKAA